MVSKLQNFHELVKSYSYNSGVAKVLARGPEVARDPVLVARGRFSECIGMWPAQACHRIFFSKIEAIEKN